MGNAMSSESGMGEGDRVELAALIIALVALLGTVAQVLQQYSASAVGYSNCGESVMGKWHKSKKRIFRAKELRFEVQFESPVFFVCPVSNKNGPIRGEPIYFVDGTSQSLGHTRALLPKEDAEEQLEKRVQTADNERASWVILLSHLQLMEKESREWQQQHYQNGPPPAQPQPLPTFESHTLAVAVQAKQRSWDTMPAGLRKPYATTTICHLIEIAAMMGIYWKEFDRSRERYRAEGNGYILMGTNVPELGVLFTLQICGQNKFQENRVIPVDEVKELCCGFVSTLFQEKEKDRRRVGFPNEDPKDLSFLQLGSMDEIAETMVRIECNTDTANYFRSSDAEHRHLFAIPFELLGMLGKTLHIRNSPFRMLPNPTPYHWDKNFFNLRRLVREYLKKISDADNDLPQTERIRKLIENADIVVRALDEDKKVRAKKALEAEQKALEAEKKALEAEKKARASGAGKTAGALDADRKVRAADVDTNAPGYSMPLLNTLHDVLDRCDDYLKASDQELVRVVVREHFQEVLKLINDKSGGEGVSDGKSDTDAKKDSGSKSTLSGDEQSAKKKPMAKHFHELTAASPEQRQEAFMELYFFKVLHHVRTRAVTSFNRRDTTEYAPSMRSRKPSIDSAAEAGAASPSSGPSSATQSSPVSPGPTAAQLRTHESGQSIPTLHVQPPDLGMDVTETLESQTSDVWCTLVFRMLCWLLLHDFNKRDVQIAKSELLGNRLSVYIA